MKGAEDWNKVEEGAMLEGAGGETGFLERDARRGVSEEGRRGLKKEESWSEKVSIKCQYGDLTVITLVERDCQPSLHQYLLQREIKISARKQTKNLEKFTSNTHPACSGSCSHIEN